jgi:hypothetical protein
MELAMLSEVTDVTTDLDVCGTFFLDLIHDT